MTPTPPGLREGTPGRGRHLHRTINRAQALVDRFNIPRVFHSVGEAVRAAGPETVFDLALMPEQYLDVLAQLPDGAAILIQKPLGNELSAAYAVRELCRRKGLVRRSTRN